MDSLFLFLQNNSLLLSIPESNEWLIIFVIILIPYFIPSVIAKKTSNAVPIFLLNLFLGWTFIGWIGALIWALNSNSNMKADLRHKDLLNSLNKNKE
jgi:Na+/proline symporter